DLVLTHDNGAQPVRWIGSRRIAAEGPLAPIRISANTFGQHRELLVSPQHRVLIRDALAELLFGDDEVLIAAKDLVNDLTVRPQVGGEVEYVHILFDKHEVVFSEGLATESFLPGPQTTKSFERAVIEEICEIFPELDPATGAGYPSSARRSLRSYEARLLLKDSTSEAA
ncbi:MAG: Hint domain-containing protein, partial [Maritimibacter sp.]